MFLGLFVIQPLYMKTPFKGPHMPEITESILKSSKASQMQYDIFTNAICANNGALLPTDWSKRCYYERSKNNA
jgi:hypothetical protein